MTTEQVAPSFLQGTRKERFEAIQHCLVPRSRTFSPSEALRSLDIINRLLDEQSRSSRQKLSFFILVIDVICILRYGNVFRNLNDTRQSTIAHMLFDSPITLLRKGLWGLNTLSRLGVYGQTELHDEIGYHLRNNPTD